MAGGADEGKPVAVIGAGLVGLCCALQLQREGLSVALIDPGGPGEGASFGNAGIFAVGSVIPLGMPGLWRKVPGMLVDPLAPLAVRPSYAPRIAPWLFKLMVASSRPRVEAISRALAGLCTPAIEHYLPLLKEAGAEALMRRDGVLYIYETEQDFADAAYEIELRRRAGIKFDVLGGDEIKQMQPALGPRFARALYMQDAAHAMHPLGISQALADLFRRKGGEILRARATGFELGPQDVRAVLTEGGRQSCSGVVISAGARSLPLVRQLGHDCPLDTERGYHVMFPNAGLEVRRAMLWSKRGFGITPMQHGLRLAGTVEFGGLDLPPNWNRAEVLRRHARRLFPDLKEEGMERWMGFRPSMPDSLPVIGRSPRFHNAYFAFGHGHLGLTLAAATGRLVADLACGRTPSVDAAPFGIERFS
ncbi:MAG: FAD-binding oxidoreductase [Alphaproteobacteria bacterium]|nr:FAD-binding oxidoreductase [Alphaproteobacteria bacterium]